MDKQYDKRTRRDRRRPKCRNSHQYTQNDTKKYQTGKHQAIIEYMVFDSRNSPPFVTALLTRSTNTRMDDQRKDHLDPKGCKPRNSSNNFRPKTCLPIIRKILTAQIRVDIYDSLTSPGLFPDEQKGCPKWPGGTAVLVYIDQHTINVSKTRRKHLPMAWIDYKKA